MPANRVPPLPGVVSWAVVMMALLVVPGTGQIAWADPDAPASAPGTTLTWGYNTDGELGDDTAADRNTPVQVCDIGATEPCSPPLQDVIAVATGTHHSVALRSDGTVLAWGDNGLGQLGEGISRPQAVPVQVCDVGATAPCTSLLTDVIAIAAAGFHSMALRSDGTVLTWGNNTFSQLGEGTAAVQATPVQVCDIGQTAACTSFLTDVVAIAAGRFHSMALRSDGTVLTWGNNTFSQLGEGTAAVQATPVQVCDIGQTAACTSFLTDIVAIAAGATHSMALRSDGTVLTWGNNTVGQLGEGTTTNRTTPTHVCTAGGTAPCTSFLTDVVAIAAGGFHSMALRSDGTVLTWGNNTFGQLGEGTTTNRTTPAHVCTAGGTAPCEGNFVTGVHIIAAGGFHSMALSSDNTALTWGNNTYGQLGDGTTTNRTTPVQVCAIDQTAPCTTPLQGVIDLAAGDVHSMALQSPAPDRARKAELP